MMIDITTHFNDRVYEQTDFAYLDPQEDAHPSPVWMGGGRTNHNIYPIQQIDIHFQDKPLGAETSVLTIPSSSDAKDAITLEKYLQYGPPQGHPELLEFAKDFVTKIQDPKCELDYLVTSGSGDSLTKLLQVFMSPGDTILVENYAYAPIFGPITALGGIMIPYPIVFESNGPVIDVPGLEELLATWETGKYKDLKKPKIIYTVPTQNPLGVTQPVEVRQEIYQVCQKYDLIIFEDDPDGYIHMEQLESFEAYRSKMLGASYLNLDVDGRVMRMETFSKLFCPGIRLGFIAARPEVIEKVRSYSMVFTKTASGVSQAVFMKTIEHLGGGGDAYLKWCYAVSKEYKERKDAVFDVFKQCQSVKKGYITPVEPDGGMFFVVKVNFEETDDCQPQMEKFYHKCLKHGVIFILGRDMAWDMDWKKKANFIRVTNTKLDTAADCKMGAERLDRAAIDFFEGE